MSFRFHRSIPIISIFHNPTSPASNQALKILRGALTPNAQPVSKPAVNGATSAKPEPAKAHAEFELDVVAAPPTPDQISIILSYLSSRGSATLSSFLSAHPSTPTGSPSSASSLSAMAAANPRIMRWPIVVNWEDGEASIGSIDGVKKMLNSLQTKKEAGPDGDVLKPKGWFW